MTHESKKTVVVQTVPKSSASTSSARESEVHVHQVWVNTKDEGKLMYTDNDGRDYEMAKLIELWQALDDEAVTTFTLNSELTPKEQLQAVIDWHIQVATDPAVNGGYKLVKVDE